MSKDAPPLPAGPLLEGSLGDDPLAAEPAPGGALIGYARVSTAGQLLDRQLHALEVAGCVRIFADKKSGKTVEREELWKALDYLRPGDTLVVPSLDRLGRSLQDLIAIVAGLRKRGVGFRSLHEAIDTTTPGGRLVFHVFAALAEFVRELIVQGTKEGLDAARARGQRLGRPPALAPEQVRQARSLLTRPEESITSIARLLGVSRATLYKHVPEAKGRPRAVQLPAPKEDDLPIAGPRERDDAPARVLAAVPDPVPSPAQPPAQTVPEPVPDPPQDQAVQEQVAPVPSGELRAVARLGAGEWATDDDDVLWWQRRVRVGRVVKAWPGSGWEARHIGGGRVTTGAGRGGRYPSRIKALTALAGEYDRTRRERTPHTELPVDGLPDGWRLTQTLAERDDGEWTLRGPGGEIAGTLTRESYGGRAEWRATAGDPAVALRLQIGLTTVTPEPTDPDRGSDSDLFRTRAAAVRALAAWHDPDL